LLFKIHPCRIKLKLLAKAISRVEDLQLDFEIKAGGDEALAKHQEDINNKLECMKKTEKGSKKAMKEVDVYVKEVCQKKKAILTGT